MGNSFSSQDSDSVTQSERILSSLDIEGVAKLINEGKIKNIVTMVGAGISTSAGIPDFRSPSTGIYDNIEEFNLPDPMSVFTLSQFYKDPKPFFEVSRRLYNPYAKPTTAHYFIRLLHEKGLLLRHYTQNVDNLERLSGLPDDKMVEAHGTFNTGHCLSCNKSYTFAFLKNEILNKRVPKCTAINCSGVIKPDVVLFDGNLPSRFFQVVDIDFNQCDLLIIIGTSLTVLPFCALIHRPASTVPRLYINREFSVSTSGGLTSFIMKLMVAGLKNKPLKWGTPGNTRDVFFRSDADDGTRRLAHLLGWEADLLKLQENQNEKIEMDFAKEKEKNILEEHILQ